jgi:hypothetical protein
MSRLCKSYGSRKGKLPRNPRGTCRARRSTDSINDSVDETAANNAPRQQRCGHQMLIINKASACLLLTPYIYAATFCSEQAQLWQQGHRRLGVPGLHRRHGTAQHSHLFRPDISQPVWCGHKLTSGLTTTNRQHDRRVKGRVMPEYASATDRDRRSLKLTIPQRQSQTAHVPSMHLGVRACSYGHATADGRLEREANIEQRWESICSHEPQNLWSTRPICMAVLEMQKR